MRPEAGLFDLIFDGLDNQEKIEIGLSIYDVHYNTKGVGLWQLMQ